MCGRPAALWCGRVPDFLGAADDQAATILKWPDGALSGIERGLLDIQRGAVLADNERAELVARGLIDALGRLTEFGQKLAYHFAEHRRQAEDDVIADEVLDRADLGCGACVLDVGCGAGPTLRQLAPRRPADRVGLDLDPAALALGLRLSDANGGGVLFLRASAHSLPFGSGQFTHVLSRVALNYTVVERVLPL